MDDPGFTIAVMANAIEPQLRGLAGIPANATRFIASHVALQIYAKGMRSTDGIFHRADVVFPGFDPPPDEERRRLRLAA